MKQRPAAARRVAPRASWRIADGGRDRIDASIGATGAELRDGRPSWLVRGHSQYTHSRLLGRVLACAQAGSRSPGVFRRMLEMSSVSSSLMNTVPFGGGHASSVLLLFAARKPRQRGALSVFALDQLGEGIVKSPLAARRAAGSVAHLDARGARQRSLVVGALFVTLMVASRWTRELATTKRCASVVTALACVMARRGTEP